MTRLSLRFGDNVSRNGRVPRSRVNRRDRNCTLIVRRDHDGVRVVDRCRADRGRARRRRPPPGGTRRSKPRSIVPRRARPNGCVCSRNARASTAPGLAYLMKYLPLKDLKTLRPDGIGGQPGPGLPGTRRGSLGPRAARGRVPRRRLAPRQRHRATRLDAGRVSRPAICPWYATARRPARRPSPSTRSSSRITRSATTPGGSEPTRARKSRSRKGWRPARACRSCSSRPAARWPCRPDWPGSPRGRVAAATTPGSRSGTTAGTSSAPPSPTTRASITPGSSVMPPRQSRARPKMRSTRSPIGAPATFSRSSGLRRRKCPVKT